MFLSHPIHFLNFKVLIKSSHKKVYVLLCTVEPREHGGTCTIGFRNKHSRTPANYAADEWHEGQQRDPSTSAAT